MIPQDSSQTSTRMDSDSSSAANTSDGVGVFAAGLPPLVGVVALPDWSGEGALA